MSYFRSLGGNMFNTNLFAQSLSQNPYLQHLGLANTAQRSQNTSVSPLYTLASLQEVQMAQPNYAGSPMYFYNTKDKTIVIKQMNLNGLVTLRTFQEVMPEVEGSSAETVETATLVQDKNASGKSSSYVGGSSTVSLNRAGVYKVTVNTDVLTSAAGEVSISLMNSGTAVTGAEASFTATTTDIIHSSFSGLVKVNCSCRCVDNSAQLTVVSSVALTASNATIIVEKLV